MNKILIVICLLFSNLVSANELEKILSDANRYTVKISHSTDTPFIEDNYSASFGSGILIDKNEKNINCYLFTVFKFSICK